MTVRPVATLKGYFNSGDTPTEANFADLIDTCAPRYDVMLYGAIWDGDSHPLSDTFGSLGAAQDVYPHATDLTNETDWCAVQAAINQVVLDWDTSTNLIYGGEVLLPSGLGRLNMPITLPYREAFAVAGTPSVSLRGQGRTATGLSYNTAVDAISGAAIIFREASVSSGAVVWSAAAAPVNETADCNLSGFFMLGPGYYWGYPAPTTQTEFETYYGFDAGVGWATAYNTTTPRAMYIRGDFDAIELPDRVSMRDVSINGFRAGLHMTGGQRVLERVRVFNCYYGIHLSRNTAHHGDFSLIKCDISGRFACVFLDKEACWFAGALTTIFNQSPYVFYKEVTTGYTNDATAIVDHGAHWPSILQHSLFMHCQFESIGNTIFAEGNATARHSIKHVGLKCCANVEPLDYSFPVTELHPNGSIRATASILDVATVRDFSLETPMAPESWSCRSTMFKTVGVMDQSYVEGVDEFINSALVETGQVFTVGVGMRGNEIKVRGLDWTGGVFKVSTAGAASTGILKTHLVGICENRIEKHTSSRPGPVGVAKENDNAGGSACICVAYLTMSSLVVKKETSATASSTLGIDITFSTTEPGTIREASGAEPVIGRSIAANSAWGEWVYWPVNTYA